MKYLCTSQRSIYEAREIETTVSISRAIFSASDFYKDFAPDGAKRREQNRAFTGDFARERQPV